MLTLKTLDKRIKELETINQEKDKKLLTSLIIQQKLFKSSSDYEEMKKALIRKGFQYIQTKTTNFKWYPNEEYEIWEKELTDNLIY